MSSDQNEETSYQQSQSTLCANNCGFFGNPSTMSLCSKCYREVCSREERAESAKAAMTKSLNLNLRPKSSAVSAVAIQSSISAVPAPSVAEKDAPEKPNRCRSCNKKVGLVGFKCKCGLTFCGSHRYPENHRCSFDFKELGRSLIEKANPVVKAPKLEKL